MEDKILIKAEKINIEKIRRIFILIGIGLSSFGLFSVILNTISNIIQDGFSKYTLPRLTSGLFECVVIALPFVLIGVLFHYFMSKVELTVTDKRVYGRTAFGKRVDLPLDSISAVAVDWLKSIAVTTASGAIKFSMIKNRDEIHKTISNLLIERQNKGATVRQNPEPVAPVSSTFSADELKKYKDLLDSGAITQEEFDAKKKQILGL
ncbi:MAG: SHOCT domain-containing protein [Ruminococcaceae bacterium]|nr:SHOCT domain-containing protein [Oscillospiraceae bacterium]